MSLPKTIQLNGYGEVMDFTLTNRRKIRYYGKTEESNESLWRTYRLKDNEVFYKTEFGWGVFIDINTMNTIPYDKSEWSFK